MRYLVLFDGECAVCNRAVQFLLDHDTEGVLHYAPLQGELAAGIVERHPQLGELDTLIHVEDPNTPEERVEVHAGAVFAIASVLPAPWNLAVLGRLVPRFATDAAYRRFAASRYSVFGRADACRVPREQDLARLHA